MATDLPNDEVSESLEAFKSVVDFPEILLELTRTSSLQTVVKCLVKLVDAYLSFEACYIDISPSNRHTSKPYFTWSPDSGKSTPDVFPEGFLNFEDLFAVEGEIPEDGKLLSAKVLSEICSSKIQELHSCSRALFYPILENGQHLVNILIFAREGDDYDSKDLDIVKYLATCVSGALERIITTEKLKEQKQIASIFSDLGEELAACSTPQEVADKILAISDELLGWDASFVSTYVAKHDFLHAVRAYDISNGKKAPVKHALMGTRPSEFIRPVLWGKPQIILRKAGDLDSTVKPVPYGETQKRSMSLIFVPMRFRGETVGLLSIQSYKVNAYRPADLEIIQALADHCASALSNSKARSELSQAKQELELRVERRTHDLKQTNYELEKEIAHRKETEENLKRSFTVLQQVIDMAGGVAYEIDYTDKRLHFMETKHLKLLGLDKESISLRRFDDRVVNRELVDQDPQVDYNEYRRSFRMGNINIFRADIEFKVDQDRTVWLNDCCLPAETRGGRVLTGVGFLLDITDRKLREIQSRDIAQKELLDLKKENVTLKRHLLSTDLQNPKAFTDIVTNDSGMKTIFLYAESIANTSQPVLITGETGVGKELLARAIHDVSKRKGSFISVNVAGIDDQSFADTLFGHSRGAFTGAHSQRKGLVAMADQGTLFLDEIGDLSPASQTKLLRLLQENEYYQLGSDKVHSSSCRIAAASNQDLSTLVEKGAFREDLFYRLQTHHVYLPPLRERRGDVPLLVNHFFRQAKTKLKFDDIQLPREIYDIMEQYRFPGNVRELEGLVFNLVAESRGTILDVDLLSQKLLAHQQSAGFISDQTGKCHLKFDEFPSLKNITVTLIREALNRTGGNQTKAAPLLGITQQSLNRRVNRLKSEGIDFSQ